MIDTTLREAMKMVTARRLVATRPHLGTNTRQEADRNLLNPQVLRWLPAYNFPYDLLIKFTEIRLAAEPGMAALAACNVDVKDHAATASASLSLLNPEIPLSIGGSKV